MRRGVAFVKSSYCLRHRACRPLLPTSEKERASWQFTVEKPVEDRFKPGANTTGWKTAIARFGVEKTSMNHRPATVWTNANLWLRRKFALPASMSKARRSERLS